MLTMSHFSGEDESKLILSFLRSSSGNPTMSETGDFEHAAPGERGDLEKSPPPGERGDLALGDLCAGIGLGWPGIGLPAPSDTSSLDCCQHTWKNCHFREVFKQHVNCATNNSTLNPTPKHTLLHIILLCCKSQFVSYNVSFSQIIKLVLRTHLKIISLPLLRSSNAFNGCILLIASDLAQDLCLGACDVTG